MAWQIGRRSHYIARRTARRLHKYLPDTVFTRLLGLLVTVLLANHLIITSLYIFYGGPGYAPSPPQPPRHEEPAQMPPQPPPMSMARPPEQHFPPEFWWAQLITLGLIGLLAGYGARRLARPIQALTQAAARLGDQLQAPAIVASGPLETRQAAQLFNQMQAKLVRQMAERSRFLAAVSHDLRTPLTRIRLRLTQLTDPKLQARLIRDSEEMTAMLDATLAYLRDDAAVEVWQRLDLLALLQALGEDAQEQGYQVSVQGQSDALLTQPASLRRCLANLLENALRYGAGQAEITLSQQFKTITISIADHGPGIAEDSLSAVFEPFVRLESSRNRHSGGVGLGLAIARDAAQRLGGSLSLRNREQGGLIAELILPRK